MQILIHAGASKLPVGVTENGVWVVLIQNVAIPLTAKASPGVVSLLEYAQADLRQQLLKALERDALPKTLLDSFPRLEVIRPGLGWNRAYWQQKALDWLEDSDWTAVTDLLLLLETQGATQKIRHSARVKLNRGNFRNVKSL